MNISIDGHEIAIQLEDISWEPPELVGRDGDYAPIRGTYWKCRLSIGRLTVALYHDWQTYFTTTTHTIIMPHPFSQEMTSFTCYVDKFSSRINAQGDCAIPNGVDIELSRLVVL